jgi:hypothetical protein
MTMPRELRGGVSFFVSKLQPHCSCQLGYRADFGALIDGYYDHGWRKASPKVIKT